MELDFWVYLQMWQSASSCARDLDKVRRVLSKGARDLSSFRQAYQEEEGGEALKLERAWRSEFRARRDEARRLQKEGLKISIFGDDLYPTSFLRSPEPPLALSFIGNPESLREKEILSVVGSRDIRPESREWMECELGAFLKSQDLVLCSGGARGVDQVAHALAVRHSRPTWVFLPSGLKQMYPLSLLEWKKEILDGGGGFISEYPPSLGMWKAHFDQRNRLIAAVGLATLIVQAQVRSGTLLTATRAAECGRPLWVVPGHPRDPAFSGNLELLLQGANLVRHHEDLTIFWQCEQEGPHRLAHS